MKQVGQIKVDLTNNQDYLEDVTNYEKGASFEANYFKSRSYYLLVFFLLGYANGLYNMFHFDDLKTLIQEINLSRLSKTDKGQLRKRIRREFLEDYLSFISWEKSMPMIHPPIPIFIKYPPEGNIEFKLLSQTRFSDHYNWFNRELSK